MKLDATTKEPVERLRLDRRNPRLMGGAERASDESIIARLYRGADLDELLQSISANGYLDIEPLVVTCEADSDEFVVLEGNRRLAALRLLREPNLVDRIASSEKLRITVPSIDEEARSTIDAVSVHTVADRAQARSFIGFKHINGPAKWDAYAKARFAADWYKAGKSEGVILDDVARAIGDRHDTVKRMVSAIYVLDQAAASGRFDVEDRFTKKFNFSHLYTALGRSPYMDYLGLGTKWARYDPLPDPVPADKLDELRRGARLDLRLEEGRHAARRAVTESRRQAPRGSACQHRSAPRARRDARPRYGVRQRRAREHQADRLADFGAHRHTGGGRCAPGLRRAGQFAA